MLGLYKDLWLSGAVTLARRSDFPRLNLKMTTFFILGNFCSEKNPFYCIPVPPDVGALQVSGAGVASVVAGSDLAADPEPPCLELSIHTPYGFVGWRNMVILSCINMSMNGRKSTEP